MYVYEDPRIEWDPGKAESNFRKHGVHFFDARAVLFDPLALTREDTRALDEQRFVTVGAGASGRVVVVVYTWRGQKARLISARAATRNERKAYEEGV